MRSKVKVTTNKNNNERKEDKKYCKLDHIKDVVNAENIRNLSTLKDLAYNSPCPIFYDATSNQALTVPNPYTVVIGNVMNQIDSIGADTIIGDALRNNGKFTAAVNQIKNLIDQIIGDAYTNSIYNGIISFISSKLSYTMTGMDLNLDIIMGKVINKFLISRQVNNIHDLVLESLYKQKNGSLTVEDSNAIILYNVFIARDFIMNDLANEMNCLLRSLAFGVPYGDGYPANHPTNEFYSTDSTRQAIVDLAQIPDDPKTVLFYSYSCEFTAQIAMISPFIEALLWQVVSAVDHIYSDTIIGDGRRGNKRDPYEYDY